MSAKIYFLKDETVQPMNEKQYEKEAELQEIVAEYPELLQRENENGQSRQIFLIQREQFTQAEEDQRNSFSLDHLMVDEDGVPVLVEVKRATDTRIRREVVAQMLDYACRISSLDIKIMKDNFRDNNGSDVFNHLPEDYWDKVKSNLNANHFKMVFVADKIPDTLRILIDFLNYAMKDIDVYGVEIRQYQTNGAKMLSTNIVGNVLEISDTSAKQQVWNVQEYEEYLREKDMEDIIPLLTDVRTFMKEQKLLSVEIGRGKYPALPVKYKGKILFSVDVYNYQDGSIECRIEISTPSLLELLNEKWNKERLEEMFMHMPRREDERGNGFFKSNMKWDFINLRAFAIPENWEYFKNTISMLMEEMSKK